MPRRWHTDTRLTNGVTYWYRLEDVDLDGTKTVHGPIFATPQFVREEFVALPGEYGLSQSYPNPFNPGTVIQYRLPEDGHVSLKVYDALGHLVKTLVDGKEDAGYKSTWWDGKDDVGSVLGSGVYFCRMDVGGRFVGVRKMVIIR